MKNAANCVKGLCSLLMHQFCNTFNKKSREYYKPFKQSHLRLSPKTYLSSFKSISIKQLHRVIWLPPSLSGSPLVSRQSYVFYSAKRLFGCLFSSITATCKKKSKLCGFSQSLPIFATASSPNSHHRYLSKRLLPAQTFILRFPWSTLILSFLYLSIFQWPSNTNQTLLCHFWFSYCLM